MKALSNPWVTGSLAAVALLLVAYQGLRPWLARPKPASRIAGPAANGPAQAPGPALSNPPPAGIDRAYARERMPAWADLPQRDPFRLLSVAAPTPERPIEQFPTPVTAWKLQGIWRQTGGRIAAINNRIYAEGDVIEGYKIERIEEDQVWLQGPQRKERLGFKAAARGATNPQAISPNPSARNSQANRL